MTDERNAEVTDAEEGSPEGIAVIGVSGRFPGAPDVAAFWRNLRGGAESISTFTEEELRDAGVDPEYLTMDSYVRAAGILDDVELFDAPFFGFNASEAEVLDPQIRIFLEQVHCALEDAGYDPERYPGLIGLYAGMYTGRYLIHNLLPNRAALRQTGDLRLRIYNDKDFLASLVAYKLDLRGPCFTVQSACSTSLVALSLACQSLVSYQCDLALAGGVTLAVPTRSGYFAHEGVFSRDGHCRAFDADASGTVNGSGAGVVVLKRLDEALRDGDPVHAVVRGWAVNNDGSYKMGYTAPSAEGQAEAVAMAQAMAGVSADTVSYVETHGTGTPLGDQVEIRALTDVFSETTDRRGFCAVGSVKTNIGHLDAAAGVASVIKTVLALKHGELPPSLNFRRPNPEINFDATPFYVNAELRPWLRGETPRRAGVSAFAVGGVNAHAVLEEAPPLPASGPSRRHQLLTLSARTPTALDAVTEAVAERFAAAAGEGAAWLADAAHTLQVGRRLHEHRRILVCDGLSDAARSLRERPPRRLLTGVATGRREVAFLFPGLGNHYVGMGAGLYRDEPAYRRTVDRCAEILEPLLGVDLRRLIAEPPGSSAGEPSPSQGEGKNQNVGGFDLRRMVRGVGEGAGELIQTRLAQPAVFVQEYALAELWRSWGVAPAGLLGHSVGEYVAACLAGVFQLEDALALVAERARRIDWLPGGAMLAVPLSEEAVAPWLDGANSGGGLDIAAVNGPESTVLAGSEEDVARVEAELAARGVTCRRAQTSHAFHSRMLRPLAKDFARRVAEVPRSAPEIPFVSGVTGGWIEPERAVDPEYWAEHMCAPVRFADGLAILAAGDPALLEVGPGQALSAWALQQSASDDPVAVSSLRYTWDDQPDQAFLLQTLGRLWVAGVEVDWEAFTSDETRRRVALPTYPFERSRYWIDPPSPGSAVAPAAIGARAPEHRQDPADWYEVPVWSQTVAPPSWTGGEGLADRWLVLADGEPETGGLGERLAARLRDKGREVIPVWTGDRFERRDDGGYTVAPGDPEGWRLLVAELADEDRLPGEIVHLWCAPPAGDREAEERDRLAVDLGFHALLGLAQALGAQASGVELGLRVVTSGVFSVTGDELVDPGRATLLGPCRVIPQELPEIDCRHLDVDAVDPAVNPRAVDRVVESVLAELAAGSDQPSVAWRSGRRWRWGLESVCLEAPQGEASRLRPGGVYLITGGLGDIGLVLAERLVRTVKARLVLAGRSAADPPAAVRERLRTLEELGAEVLVVAADITDREETATLVARIRKRFGTLDGVVHAAGVYPGGMIQTKTREQAEAVLGPKVSGTRVLAEAVAELQPDFILLCSSLTAHLGSFGLVDHAAANAYLGAFAQSRAGVDGPFTLAVDWDTWIEVGQAARAARQYGVDAGSEGSKSEGWVAEWSFDPANDWVLGDHRMGERGLLPGTAYLELVRAAYAVGEEGEPGAVEIRDLVFARPLLVEGRHGVGVRLDASVTEGGSIGFVVEGRPEAGGEWLEHARGTVAPAEVERVPERRDLDAVAEALGSPMAAPPSPPPGPFRFGPRWRGLATETRVSDREILARLELPEEFAGDLDDWPLHPALLDAATGLAQLFGDGRYLPFGYERIIVHRLLPRRLASHLRRAEAPAGGNFLAADVTLLDLEGEVLVEIEGYLLKRLPVEATEPAEVSGTAAEVSGTAAEVSGTGSTLHRALSEGLRPQDGAEAFTRVLSRRLTAPQVLVAPRDVGMMIERARHSSRQEILDEAAALRARHKHRRAASAPYEAPRNQLEEELCRQWQELLGIDRVGIHDGFFEVGGDSLTATQMLGHIRSSYGVEMPLRDLFAAATVAELAVRIVQIQADTAGSGELDDLLQEVESLSEEELAEMLGSGEGE